VQETTEWVRLLRLGTEMGLEIARGPEIIATVAVEAPSVVIEAVVFHQERETEATVQSVETEVVAQCGETGVVARSGRTEVAARSEETEVLALCVVTPPLVGMRADGAHPRAPSLVHLPLPRGSVAASILDRRPLTCVAHRRPHLPHAAESAPLPVVDLLVVVMTAVHLPHAETARRLCDATGPCHLEIGLLLLVGAHLRARVLVRARRCQSLPLHVRLYAGLVRLQRALPCPSVLVQAVQGVAALERIRKSIGFLFVSVVFTFMLSRAWDMLSTRPHFFTCTSRKIITKFLSVAFMNNIMLVNGQQILIGLMLLSAARCHKRYEGSIVLALRCKVLHKDTIRLELYGNSSHSMRQAYRRIIPPTTQVYLAQDNYDSSSVRYFWRMSFHCFCREKIKE
jgi:hypothetical protein